MASLTMEVATMAAPTGPPQGPLTGQPSPPQGLLTGQPGGQTTGPQTGSGATPMASGMAKTRTRKLGPQGPSPVTRRVEMQFPLCHNKRHL